MIIGLRRAEGLWLIRGNSEIRIKIKKNIEIIHD